jgi:hypothetical protein
MKKTGSVLMFLMVMAMVAAPVFAEITLNPNSEFCDPNAKGFGDANQANGITATYTSESMFIDPAAKGLGDADKSNGLYFSGSGDVAPTRTNMFTGEPF